MKAAELNQLALDAANNDMAFEQLYTHSVGEMHAFVMKRVGHQQVTEDLVSEIFTVVVRNLPNFDPRKASYRTWLYRIATTRMIDYYRKGERQKLYSEGAEYSEESHTGRTQASDHLLDNPFANFADIDVLRWCMENLDPEHLQVVQLRYYEDHTQKQIAAIVDKKPNAVGVLLHRIIKKLRTCVDSQPA